MDAGARVSLCFSIHIKSSHCFLTNLSNISRLFLPRTKTSNYFSKCVEKPPLHKFDIPKSQQCERIKNKDFESERTIWRLKSREGFILSLSKEERDRRGGLAKLEKQPSNRYFKKKLLSEIVMLHGSCGGVDEKTIGCFVHFLKGKLKTESAIMRCRVYYFS